jgi:hypothetical protein
MQWLPYTVFAGLAVIAVVVGVVGGGVWWVVTGIGVVGIGGWLVVDRYFKRREAGGERAAAEVNPHHR